MRLVAGRRVMGDERVVVDGKREEGRAGDREGRYVRDCAASTGVVLLRLMPSTSRLNSAAEHTKNQRHRVFSTVKPTPSYC